MSATKTDVGMKRTLDSVMLITMKDVNVAQHDWCFEFTRSKIYNTVQFTTENTGIDSWELRHRPTGRSALISQQSRSTDYAHIEQA